MTKFKVLGLAMIFSLLAFLFLVPNFTLFDGSNIVSAEKAPTSDQFLKELQDSGNLVAFRADEIPNLLEELAYKKVSEKILFLSPEAVKHGDVKLLSEAYQSGILIVAIDVPISNLYEIADAVQNKKPNSQPYTKDLNDLVSPHKGLLVVSMIYSFEYMSEFSYGYAHFTDFYTKSEHVERVAKEFVEGSEKQLEHINSQSSTESQANQSFEVETVQENLSVCETVGSITWSNYSNPGTKPNIFGQCRTHNSNFKPYFIGLSGTFNNNCGDWHEVGSFNQYHLYGTASSISGSMNGFPGSSNPNYCLDEDYDNQNHKSPVSGTANIAVRTRDYANSAAVNVSYSSSLTVFYP